MKYYASSPQYGVYHVVSTLAPYRTECGTRIHRPSLIQTTPPDDCRLCQNCDKKIKRTSPARTRLSFNSIPANSKSQLPVFVSSVDPLMDALWLYQRRYRQTSRKYGHVRQVFVSAALGLHSRRHAGKGYQGVPEYVLILMRNMNQNLFHLLTPAESKPSSRGPKLGPEDLQKIQEAGTALTGEFRTPKPGEAYYYHDEVRSAVCHRAGHPKGQYHILTHKNVIKFKVKYPGSGVYGSITADKLQQLLREQHLSS